MRERFELWDIIEQQLEEKGDRVFLIDEPGQTTTLAEFWNLSGRVYNFLKHNGITYEDVVMFCLPRSSAIYAAMIGTLRAGAAYVCTEAGFNSKRADYIKKNCSCRLYVDENVWQQILATDPLDGAEPVDLHDKAFLTYTSGTTSDPKGVIHEYGTITLARKNTFVRDSVRPIIPPFDYISISITLYNALYYHSSLAIVPEQYKKDSEQLVSYLKTVGTTCGYLSPSFLRVHGVQELGWKLLIASSESADGLMPKGVDCINLYASSESGCTVSTYRITKPASPMPIGQGLLNMKVLRQDGTETKTGEKGELCYQQPYFRGYLNLPKKTAETIRDGWVHSGDQAVRLPDGNVAITGRMNEQFVIEGHAISPEEIQNALKLALGIKNSVVRGFVFKELNSICVFYTDPINIDQAEAAKALLQYLPPYMIPTNYYRLDSFPMLPTGKKNKTALLPPEGSWKTICNLKAADSNRIEVMYGFGESKSIKLFEKGIPLHAVVSQQKRSQALYAQGAIGLKPFSIVRVGMRYGILSESLAENKKCLICRPTA